MTGTEEQIAKIFQELKLEDRAEAAENYSAYLRVIAKIYDDLDEKGTLKDVLLRAQWEKRNREKPVSQNDSGENDDTPTSTEDSNESTS